ncbi:undecaprenyl-diphosphate phosphatase [Phenylobacterium sp.]|uniref:undecaprenyl-diphosphate phosphatase n=1 Tax=Phenylobacterium sp. TaxID=1871053 RepID=UPI0025DB5CD5|nr:undecaprenyl-diphosphate phosphatase [Phenylobacterium sp.]
MDQNSLLSVIVLGIIEGLTEFLPVSSTGHLILASEILGFKGPAESTFKIVVQLGAILAVLVVYFQRFWNAGLGALQGRRRDIAFARNILLAVVPAMVIGVFAYDGIKALLESPMVVAVALIVGGIAILIIERLAPPARIMEIESLSWLNALTIGLVQCLAMVPGVSRSGATIMGSLLMGVERKTAAEFTFFLAAPTMVAATAYDLYKSWDQLNFDDFTAIAIGFVVAFLTALLVVKSLVAVVGRYGFAPFAWYRIVLGSVAAVLLLAT